MANYKMVLCYDGTRYRGWQKQGNTGETIQGKLEKLLSRLLNQEIEVNGSGRTDAGVHALAQVASFRAETDLSCAELLTRIREHLPDDIGLLSIEKAPPRFHARLSAAEKSYLYRVWNSDKPCVFERKYVCVYPEPLDIAAMERAARLLEGQHDFSSFSTGRRRGGTVRTLREIRIERTGEEIRLFFTGDGFLYNMVRILTGTLLEVGTCRRSAESVASIFDAGVRSAAGFTAPAQGLCLHNVKYGTEWEHFGQKE